MEIYWTDELVLDLLKKHTGQTTDMSVIDEFKESKAALPSNALILSFLREDRLGTITEVLFKKNSNIFDYMDYPTLKLEYPIKSCQCNGAIFSLDDIVYNNANYKKYGGKWSNYAIKIDSLDLRIKKVDGKIVSSLLLINNFYEVNKFIKRD